MFGESIGVVAHRVDVRSAQRGDTIDVRVYWQAIKPPTKDYFVRLSLMDEDGGVLWERERRPGRGLSPTDMWQAGQVIPDLFRVVVPADAQRGKATIVLGAIDRGSGPLLTSGGESEVVLGAVSIE
jgi:hypothetical protein